MTPDAWLLTAAVVLLLLALWIGWTLTRLRRLEARVARAWTALDTQLQRRAGLAEELARSFPAAVGEERAAYLAAFAADARTPVDGDRELAENVLGRSSGSPPNLPGVPAALRADLAGTATRVALARRFYNDAVRDTGRLRRRRLPRLLRLHGSRPAAAVLRHRRPSRGHGRRAHRRCREFPPLSGRTMGLRYPSTLRQHPVAAHESPTAPLPPAPAPTASSAAWPSSSRAV